MLKKIVRHGFIFWEAKPHAGPPKGDRPDLFARVHNLAQLEANVALSLPPRPSSHPLGGSDAERRPAQSNPANPAACGELVQFSDAAPAPGAERGLPSAEHIARIQTAAMEVFGVSREAFFSDDAKRTTVWARLASMVTCHFFTIANQKQIAQAHGRDDAVVCRALSRFDGMRRKYPDFDAKVSALQATQALPRLAA